MRHLDKSFNQVFEQYLFSTANACIDLVKPACQTDLINLLIEVNQTETSPTPARGNAAPTEWGQVLKAPVNRRSVDEQWLGSIRQSHQDRQRRYILRLEEVIETTHQRLQQLEFSVLGEPQRSQFAAYYGQTLLSYQQQLDQALLTLSAWSGAVER